MNTKKIRWISLEREYLPSALFGHLQSAGHSYSMNFGRPRPDANRITLGYADREREAAYNPPSLIVVDGDAAPDMLSWLRTYAPATSPLSQFARVVTEEDWLRLADNPRGGQYLPLQREDQWACLVLGEALAQGDSEAEISNIPISRASACFSNAVARTAIIYGRDEATDICISRLKHIENDRRFVHRSVSVADLIPAWLTMTTIVDEEIPVADAAALVVEAVFKFI